MEGAEASKTLFSLKDGTVVGEWIKFPPVINNILRIIVGPPEPLIIYPIRESGGNLQVQVDVNLKERFESNYWRGILDAQGKETSDYY